MIKKEKILIWTTCDKDLFCERHKLNKKSYTPRNEFKNIKFTNFNVSERDLIKNTAITNSSEYKYNLSKTLSEKFKVESISHYDVIIFDLKCVLILPFNDRWEYFRVNSFIVNILINLIKKHRNKKFLILNAHLEDDLDNIFRWNRILNLEKKRSSEIQSINQTNIDGKIFSYYCLDDREIKKDKNIKKYRPLWHAIGNKNEITGFQVDNMYFLPFGCDALASILKNIDSLFEISNAFNEEKIFHLLKTKDSNSSFKSLKFIDNLWKKHAHKEELINDFCKTKQELDECISEASLFLKALECHDSPLESVIKNILKNFKFEILPQIEKDHDRADIIFSFNYNQLKYITIVEVKSYEKNKIDRKPFNQVRLWSDKFTEENSNVKFDKMIKLIIINNGYKSNESINYDQRILKIPENIKKHYGYKDVDSPDDEIVDDIKVITTLNLVKILYSDEEHGAELLKKKLVSTKAMQIESN